MFEPVSQSANDHGIPVEVLPDDTVRLREAVSFSVVELCGVTLAVDVPKGFVCDGASIPRVFWSVVGHPLSGGPLRAAIIHDALCVQASTRAERRFADTVFYWVLEQCRVPYWRRLLLFLAVRVYALCVWRQRLADKPEGSLSSAQVRTGHATKNKPEDLR